MDNYEIIETLGYGAFSTVYLVKDKISNKLYSMKKIPKHKDPNIHIKTTNQINIGLYLNQNGYDNYIDHYVTETHYYLIFKYLQGSDLFTYQPKITHNNMFDIFIQMAEELQKLHSLKIVHNDIKPENIMLMVNGKIQFIDFELSRTPDVNISQKYEIRLSNEQDVSGSIYYISPEKYQKKTSDFYKSDIYSLGSTYYALIMADFPYQSNDKLKYDTVYLHNLSDPNIVPKPFDQYIPLSLEQLIYQMLDKNYQNRPTLDEIISHLSKFTSSLNQMLNKLSITDT